MLTTRADRLAALEAWADNVDVGELVEVDAESLRLIAEFAQRRDRLESALVKAVDAARRDGHTWSEIGMMLGVTKQSAQRKYSRRAG